MKKAPLFQAILWPRSHVCVVIWKRRFFVVVWFGMFCFVFSGLAYRWQQCIRWQQLSKMHLIKMLSKVEIFEHVCFLFTCRRTKTGGFRIPWCHKSYATSCYRISIVFKLRGWAWTLKTLRVEAYFSESGDKVSVSKNIRIRVDELLFIIYQNDYNLLKLAILIFRVCLDL